MQFPESWLRAFADPDMESQALADCLTMAGLEVEEAESAAPPFSGVVVARIAGVEPHPNADKLRVCRVDDGSGELLQIVCGAPNAAEGLKVPLARLGARLPGGFAIGKAKMRGIESFGMLCSSRELGLSQEHDGLLVLDDALPEGQDIREALDLDDTVFTLKLTPNRADCLSILGVAREVSALTGAALTLPEYTPVPVTLDERLPVEVKDKDLCGRFAGRVIRGVNARAQTPAWMKARLERAGQRSLSVLVDISNYVMLELGRPSHVFDLDKIQGSLEVRWARKGEQITLLNGQTLALEPDVGVIVAGDVPESLAGIMGGEATSVTLDTTNIYLETAYWHPEAIMGKARRYRFGSEASHRFERGVDFSSIPEHIERITRLIVDICGGSVGPVDDLCVALPPRNPVGMRLSRCQRVLGVDVTHDEAASIFTRLQLPFTVEGETFVVTPPAYRFDLSIEEDLIEEVARVHGFENIPDVPPVAEARMNVPLEVQRSPHELRQAIASREYQEVINFSFVEEAWEKEWVGNADPIRLLNPIASHLSVMRSSLIPGLVANIVHNAKHRQSRVRVFELGRVFARDAEVKDADLHVAGIRQPQYLAGAAWGPAFQEQWGVPVRQVDFFDVKKDVEVLMGAKTDALVCKADQHPLLHPGRGARLVFEGRPIGWLGELHPRWVQESGLAHAPVVFELDAQAVSEARLAQAGDLSRQPVVVRDLAVWAGVDVEYQSLLDTLHKTIAAEASLAIVREIRLFDVWRDTSAGQQATEKSLALRFWLQDAEATLDDQRVEQCIHRLLDALVRTHGVRQRA